MIISGSRLSQLLSRHTPNRAHPAQDRRTLSNKTYVTATRAFAARLTRKTLMIEGDSRHRTDENYLIS